MIKRIYVILVGMAALLVQSCVHQWPEEPSVDPTLVALQIVVHPADTMTLYENGNPWVDTRTGLFNEGDVNEYDLENYDPSRFDRRYIIHVWNNEDYDRELILSKVMLLPADDTSSVVLPMEVHAQNYKVAVWQDFVEKGYETDKFYLTDTLTHIRVPQWEDYVGSTDFKDANSACMEFSLKDLQEEYFASRTIDVQLIRPFAKLIFVSNDLDKFIYRQRWRIMQDLSATGTADAEVSQEQKSELMASLNVIHCYDGYLPTGYNLLTGKRNSAQLNYRFVSIPYLLPDNNVVLSYDYVMVEAAKTSVDVHLEIYDNEGVKLNTVSPVTVPLERNKVTVVMDNFLTKHYTPGIGIDPNFDGEINIRFIEKHRNISLKPTVQDE